jgi:hypothetical protein
MKTLTLALALALSLTLTNIQYTTFFFIYYVSLGGTGCAGL